jgi:hypothetical protein
LRSKASARSASGARPLGRAIGLDMAGGPETENAILPRLA